MKRSRCLLLVALWLLLGVGPALAAEAASPVQDVLSSLLQLVAVILTGLVAWGAKRLLAKFKIDLSEKHEELLRKAVREGIFYAEEWAAKKINLNEKAASGQEKMVQAINYVATQVPGVKPDELRPLIESVLGSLQGLGASKKIGEVPATTQ